MKSKLLSFLFSLTFLLASVSAHACKCIEPNIERAYKEANTVVHVTAGDVIKTAGNTGISAVLTVLESWKNKTTNKIIVNSLTSCQYPMTNGTDYILFLRIEPNGLYSTGRCSGNKALPEGKKTLEWLKREGDI